jgi:secreted Zn-dependent insulinase-like peptidase
MKEEEFETNKLSLIAKRLEKPKKLSGRAGKYWSEIVSQQYNFNRDEVETDDLRNITKDNIIEFFDTYIDSKSNVRKKVVCYMVPSDTSEIKKETIPEMDIIPVGMTDIAAFKSSLSLYPLPKAMSNPKDMVRKIE